MEQLGLALEFLQAAAQPLDDHLPLLRYDAQLAKLGVVAGHPLPSSGTANLVFPSGVTYSGDIVNGLRQGRGTLVLEDGTRYQGTFEKGALHGQGVIAYADGSVYRGDVYFGVRHGSGSFTFPGGAAEYVGEWRKGQRNGQGSLWYGTARGSSASYYRGQWVADKRHGRGMLRYASGNVFVGQWVGDEKVGMGRMAWMDAGEEYVGYWLSDAPHGYGVHSWYAPPPPATTGGARSSSSSSPGRLTDAPPSSPRSPGGSSISGSGAGYTAPFSQWMLVNRFKGTFVRGYRCGMGIFQYSNGARYVGEWYADVKHGHGVWTAPEGSVFDGLFVEDRVLLSSELSGGGSGAGQDGAVMHAVLAAAGYTPDGPREGATSSPDASLPPTAASLLMNELEGRLSTGTPSPVESAHATATPASAGRMRSAGAPFPVLALPSEGSGVGSSGVSSYSSSPVSSPAPAAALPGGREVNGDPLYAMHISDLLPAGPALLQWFVQAHPGRAGEVVGVHPGVVDPAKADALTGKLQKRALQGLCHVLLRWNTRMTGWYSTYSKLPRASAGAGEGCNAAWAGAASTPILTGPNHGTALTQPTALLSQLQALRTSVEVGCMPSSPILRMHQLWRFVTDVGALAPPTLTRAALSDMLLIVRRKQSKAVVDAAIRLANVSAMHAAKVAVMRHGLVAPPPSGGGRRVGTPLDARSKSPGKRAGGAQSASSASRPPPSASAHMEEKKGDSDGEGATGQREPGGVQVHSLLADARAAFPTLAQIVDGTPLLNGLVLPHETADALSFVLAAEGAALTDAHRQRYDPDCPVLFREFVEVLVRLATGRYAATKQLRPAHAPAPVAASAHSVGAAAGGSLPEDDAASVLGSQDGFGSTLMGATLTGTVSSAASVTVGGTHARGRRVAPAAAASNSLLATTVGPESMTSRLAPGPRRAVGDPLLPRPGSPGAKDRLNLTVSAGRLAGAGSTPGAFGLVSGLLDLHPGLHGEGSGGEHASAATPTGLWRLSRAAAGASQTDGEEGAHLAPSSSVFALDESHPDALAFIVEAFLWCFVGPRALAPPPTAASPLNLLPPIKHAATKGKKAAPREPTLQIPPAPPAPQPWSDEDPLCAAQQPGGPSGHADSLPADAYSARLHALFASSSASIDAGFRAQQQAPLPAPLGELVDVVSLLEQQDALARTAEQGSPLSPSSTGSGSPSPLRPSSGGSARSHVREGALPSDFALGLGHPAGGAKPATGPDAVVAGLALADPSEALGAELRAAFALTSALLPLGDIPAATVLHAIRGPAAARPAVEEGAAETEASILRPPSGGGARHHLATTPDVPSKAEAAAVAAGVCTTVLAGSIVAALRASGLLETRPDSVSIEAGVAAAAAAGVPPSLPLPPAAGTATPSAAAAAVAAAPPAKGGKAGPPAGAVVQKSAAELAAEAAADPDRAGAAHSFVAHSSQVGAVTTRVSGVLDALPVFDERAVVEEVWAVMGPVTPHHGVSTPLPVAGTSTAEVGMAAPASVAEGAAAPGESAAVSDRHSRRSSAGGLCAYDAPLPVSAFLPSDSVRLRLPWLHSEVAGGAGEDTSLVMRIQDACATLVLTKPEFSALVVRLSLRYAQTIAGRAERVHAAYEALRACIAGSVRTDLEHEAQRFYKKHAVATVSSTPHGAATEAPGSGDVPPAAQGADAVTTPGGEHHSASARLRAASGALRRAGALAAFTSGPGGSVDPGLLALSTDEGEREAHRVVTAALGKLAMLARAGRGASGALGVPPTAAEAHALSSGFTGIEGGEEEEAHAPPAGTTAHPADGEQAGGLPFPVAALPLAEGVTGAGVGAAEAALMRAETVLPLILAALGATACHQAGGGPA